MIPDFPGIALYSISTSNPGPSHMLGKKSTTEPQLSPLLSYSHIGSVTLRKLTFQGESFLSQIWQSSDLESLTLC